MMAIGRRLPYGYWLVALAFFVSWFADSVMYFTGGEWQATYFWLPVQLWLVLLALIRAPVHRLLSAIALLLLASVSLALSWPGPDYLITVAGSVAILYLARGWLAFPLYIYFGAGTVAYLIMVPHAGSASILTPWLWYQGCRLFAFIAFIGIIAPLLIRQHKKRGRL